MQNTFADNRNEIATSFLLVLAYGVFISCFQLFLYKCGIITALPDAQTLYRWDSGIYMDVSKIGYSYHPPKDNTGVFILFPWIWRLTHLGLVGICVVNYLFFGLGFSILSGIFRLTATEKFLWLSVPTTYIMAIPYSEALFFLLMSITFYGIVANKRWMVWIGLFLATITRATGIFLLPSLLIMELLSSDKRGLYKVILSYLINYAAPIIIGLAFFILYQYYATGVWFVYFIMQQKYEGHIFNIPILPFSSMEGPRNMWISALAIFCCFISIIVVAQKVFRWLFRNATQKDKILVLSMVFLGATLVKTIFYNPTWTTGTTLTIGINRYVFATPFFYVFLFYYTNRAIPYKLSQYIVVFILCNIVWLSCGAYLHIQNWLYFNCMTVLVFLFMLLSDKKKTWPVLILVVVNVFLQIIMFDQYLRGLYLD
jgi:hypothetical protein